MLGYTQPGYCAQSTLGPPIYSKTCLPPVPHGCLQVRAGSPMPMIPSNALRSIPPSSSPSEDTTAPPCFLWMPWQTTGRSISCYCTHFCCAREQAQYGLGMLKWMNFQNKRKKLVFFRVQVQLNQFKHPIRYYLSGPGVTLPAGKSRVVPP